LTKFWFFWVSYSGHIQKVVRRYPSTQRSQISVCNSLRAVSCKRGTSFKLFQVQLRMPYQTVWWTWGFFS